jgi:hypothetical protein
LTFAAEVLVDCVAEETGEEDGHEDYGGEAEAGDVVVPGLGVGFEVGSSGSAGRGRGAGH